MKIRIAVVVLALACLGVFVATVQIPPAVSPEGRIIRPASIVPAEVAALSGVWEGIGPDAIPSRLVVEDVHENWATILFAWGDNSHGQSAGGSLRAKAKVLPSGGLYWRQVGGVSFHLAPDRTTLVVTLDKGGRESVRLMRRVPAEGAPTVLARDWID